MKPREELKRIACAAIDQHRARIIDFGDAVAAEPELGFKEFKTAEKFKALLTEFGYGYEDEVAVTGVIAQRKGRESKLRVAVMGEMDAVALPGHPDADPLTGAVHACGHNCMMASLAGVAIALREAGIMEHLSGDVVLMAVPAEECIDLEYRNRLRAEGKIHFFGGKQEFIRLGKLDDINMMLMQHSIPSSSGMLAGAGSPTNGFMGKMVRYTGKAAHAGSAPFDGVNALNAAILGLMGIHAQRETFRDEDHIRVHPIITRGGDLVNIVPADVRLETFVRGANMEAILDASRKVDRALRAGADAVGAEVEITDFPGYLPVVLSEPLMDLMYDNLRELLGENVQRLCTGLGGGSSDQGDVSQLMPSLQAFFGGITGGLHAQDYALCDRELAYITAAKALVMLIIDLLSEGAKRGLAVKKAFIPVLTKAQYLRAWGGIQNEAGE